MSENHILITAGATNTGYGIAEKFVREGWNVHITSRSAERSEEAAAKLRAQNPDAKVYAAALELRNPEEIFDFFADFRNNFGRLDAFVQCAADLGITKHDIFDFTVEEMDSLLETNLRGGFFACREAARIMKDARKGSIITLSSVTYDYCVRNRVGYITTKGGIVSMTKAMALDLAPFGIRVNCILPGLVTTDRWDRMPDAEKARRRAVYPLRESYPSDIANAAWYLATDMSENVTGTEMVVDGGACIQAATAASNPITK